MRESENWTVTSLFQSKIIFMTLRVHSTANTMRSHSLPERNRRGIDTGSWLEQHLVKLGRFYLDLQYWGTRKTMVPSTEAPIAAKFLYYRKANSNSEENHVYHGWQVGVLDCTSSHTTIPPELVGPVLLLLWLPRFWKSSIHPLTSPG